MANRHFSHSGGVNWALLAALAIGAFFLFGEHRVHALGVLPFLLLAACPLMHFFMHREHGDNGEHKPPHTDKGEQP
ncbi:MAG: DUF2933 domain-containing protein [Burkholderiales bacterium]